MKAYKQLVEKGVPYEIYLQIWAEGETEWDNKQCYIRLLQSPQSNVKYGISPHSSTGIIDGLVVCDGYTAIFNRFMRIAGIESREISGTSWGGSHAWNQVKLGDNGIT